MECAARATSKDRRPLKFSNESISGGFLAQYADTGESYPSHECYVDGSLCHADEHYFGGIVIQPV
jgi:c-di-GMP-binding flagellar brake protein YcgR